MEIRQRIFEARTGAKLSQQALADATGKTRGAVAQWESGAVRPRHSTLKLIAKATNKPLAWLETGIGGGKEGLTVVGNVRAGNWEDGNVVFEEYTMPVSPHPDYPSEAQRLWKVSGNSVNKIVIDGEFVHTVDIHLADLEPKSGDMVIVRSLEHGKAEYTAKRIILKPSGWILRPESNDPQWQKDIKLNGNDDTEISVTDIIIAKWTPIERGKL